MSEIITSQDTDASTNVEKEHIEDDLKLGNWFWVNRSGGDWLGCVMELGSNYVEIRAPSAPHSGARCIRLHLKNVHEVLRFEPNPKAAIIKYVKHYQSVSQSYLNEIKEITARLGISLQPSLANHSQSAGNELMVLSGHYGVDEHKAALIKAKEVELPELFKKLKETNEEVARWLSAESLPLKAVMSEMEGSLGVIDDRIFSVSLYAGLAEECIVCSDGEPAEYHEKLHVMQRRLYMDEEALIGYRKGGMEFKNIREFDEWIARPDNRNRILPFPRCIVAMRVRRYTKEREPSRCLSSAIVRMNAEISDKYTYLYIRNGEKVSRLVCEIDFDEMIFPEENAENKPLMVKMFGKTMQQTMTRDEYDYLVKLKEENKRNYDRWIVENPEEQWKNENPNKYYAWANPYDRMSDFRAEQWTPFDSSNVYFDDCQKAMAKQLKHYNYIALIIQGVFDRSSALHPHPPVKTWEPESFAASIKLVYDSSNVLNYGDAPDFEAYRTHCNSFFTTGSVSVGQEEYWEIKEAEKECRLRDSSWRYRNDNYRPTRWRPDGNEGMGYVATVHHWNPKTKRAEFRWFRERLRDSDSGFAGSKIETKITVPADRIFNISAYKKGDYLQFFRDPRTREKYLQWAPLLMAAEDYVSE